MTLLIAQAQSVWLLSMVKPIVWASAVILWARMVGHVDKDLETYRLLPRWQANGVFLMAGIIGFGVWLAMTWFWVGLIPVAVLVVGPIVGYAYYRHPHVPQDARWNVPWAPQAGTRTQRRQQRADRRASVVLLDPAGEPIPVPVSSHPQAQAHRALESLLETALPRHAQCVEILADLKQASVTLLQDTVSYEQATLAPSAAMDLIDYLKLHAGLDLKDKRKRQASNIAVQSATAGQHTLGITTSGSLRGLTLTLEIDPESRAQIAFNDLGLLSDQQNQLSSVLSGTHRLVLASSPSGHGQTTTLFGLLGQHDPYTQSVMTLESRLISQIHGYHQHQITPGTSSSQLETRIRTMLHQTPDVFLFSGPIDNDTAQVLAASAKDHRIYAGLNQPDTFSALRMWMNMIGDSAVAAKSLGAIVCSRLVRKLCTTCRAAYKPDPHVLHKLNLSVGLVGQLYQHTGQVLVKGKPSPCPTCFGIGYRGLVGVYEVMALDSPARRLLREGQLDQLRSYLRKRKMLWLQEAALHKAVDGQTSISEIMRVLAPAPRQSAAV